MKEYPTLDSLKKDIDTMTIADLRIAAREFGVVPRNHKRAELIEKIIASYTGKLDPEVPKRPGRPTKSSGVANEFKEKEEEAEAGAATGDNDNVDPVLPRTGILEVMSEGYGFLRTHNYSSTPGKDYYVSSAMVSRMNLRSGDKLRVVLHQYPDRTTPTVIFVKEINDTPCTNMRRTPFDLFPQRTHNARKLPHGLHASRAGFSGAHR